MTSIAPYRITLLMAMILATGSAMFAEQVSPAVAITCTRIRRVVRAHLTAQCLPRPMTRPQFVLGRIVR